MNHASYLLRSLTMKGHFAALNTHLNRDVLNEDTAACNLENL